MSKQKTESRNIKSVIGISHPVWEKNFYIQEPMPVGIVKYNGKHLDSKSAPNRLVCYDPKDKLGSGGFGTVYEGGAYQINYKLNELTYKKNKVVKVINGVNEKAKKAILAEYAQGKKAPQLGMKEPVFSGSSGNETCYIVMNRLPGKELFDLVADSTIGSLPVHKKLELTHKLLLALRDQVTRQGVVHRDIKAENIMVQLEPEIQVNIIDYGLAKEQNTDDGEHPGSPGYAAPELFEGKPHDIACDVFSMAKVIAILWINDYSLYNPQYWEMFTFALESAQRIELAKSKDLSENLEILHMLQNMLNPNQHIRMTIQDAIESFENTYPKFKEHVEITPPQSEEKISSLVEIDLVKQSHEQLIQERSKKDQQSINNILIHLSNLENYAGKISKTHSEDKKTITEFIKGMRQIINTNKKSIQDIKKDCVEKLSNPKIIECAKKHKYVQYVLKNIAAGFIGLGLFYGIACGINKLATGRATFFHNEISDAHHNITNEFKSIIAGG